MPTHRTAHRLLVALVLLGAASPAVAGASPRASAVQLSDERTFTRWAHSEGADPVRRSPSLRSRRVTRLRRVTENGEPEVYLALRSSRDPDGRLWVEIRLPRRPNGSTGWVRRDSLGPFSVVDTYLEIDRRRLRATLRKAGRDVWSARVGVGAARSPTPAGRFYVREKLRNLAGDPIYGPWAFGTSAYSRLSDWPRGGVVGIHGTDRPELVPGRPSHGCVRLRNRDVVALQRLLPVGTPVRIR